MMDTDVDGRMMYRREYWNNYVEVKVCASMPLNYLEFAITNTTQNHRVIW